MRRLWLTVAFLGASGCTSSLYAWKSYEASIHRQYRSSDFDLNEEIALLEREVRETEAAGKLVPPGEYAHLAYLYHEVGDRPSTIRYLEAERRAFPESATFVGRLLEGMP